MADGLVVRQQRRYLASEGCIRLRKVLEHVFVDAGFGELERSGSLPDGRPVVARLGNAALGDGFVHVRNLLFALLHGRAEGFAGGYEPKTPLMTGRGKRKNAEKTGICGDFPKNAQKESKNPQKNSFWGVDKLLKWVYT